jgi:hypothetical protein
LNRRGDSSWLWVDGQLTTAQQRRLLFATCQATGNLTPACRSAQLGCRTCYSGKPRFDQRGSAALDQFASFAPKGPFVRAARGTPFTAHAFAAFAQDTGCIHVPIARRRMGSLNAVCGPYRSGCYNMPGNPTTHWPINCASAARATTTDRSRGSESLVGRRMNLRRIWRF